MFLEERQQQSDLHCPGVLLRRGSHCLSVHFHCRQQHSSQERPTKILASPLLSVSCTDALAGGKVVSEVIILCLPFSIPVMAPSTACGGAGILCLLVFYCGDTRVVQKAEEVVPRKCLDFSCPPVVHWELSELVIGLGIYHYIVHVSIFLYIVETRTIIQKTTPFCGFTSCASDHMGFWAMSRGQCQIVTWW